MCRSPLGMYMPLSQWSTTGRRLTAGTFLLQGRLLQIAAVPLQVFAKERPTSVRERFVVVVGSRTQGEAGVRFRSDEAPLPSTMPSPYM